MLGLALVRLLEIIGEAATQVSPPLKEATAEIPWKEMQNLRNRLIHGYFAVDMNIVWQIVHTDIPALIDKLDFILHQR
jgi:uncharacterized protein with HEPN domain